MMRKAILLVLLVFISPIIAFRTPGNSRVLYSQRVVGRKLMSCLHSEEKSSSKSVLMSYPESVKTFWQFSRPHTIIGTTLSISTLLLYASPDGICTEKIARCWISTIIPAIATNIFITGLNQIADIDIDRINKPYLPLPAGRLTITGAISIVLACFVVAIFSVVSAPWPLKLAIFPSLLLGALYSLPPLRLKQLPLLAAGSIAVVRGLLINIGIFAHIKMMLSNESLHSFPWFLQHYPDMLWIAGYFTLFGVVIALLKDTPDVVGDQAHQINTFSTHFGVMPILALGKNILIGALLAVIGGLVCSGRFRQWSPLKRTFLVSALASFIAYLLWSWKEVYDTTTTTTEDPRALYQFYLKVWNVFYASYLLLPFLK